MDTIQFIKTVNHERLTNKNKWYYFTGHVNGVYIEIKAFGTWLQLCRREGIDFGGCMDISVKDFKKQLQHVAEYKAS